MEESSRWRLSGTDIKKWGRNTLVFSAPVAIIYLTSIVGPVQENGLQWSDFTVTPMVSGAMVLYVINVLLDVFRKLANGPTE